jgi:hypothetical protein
MTPRVTFAGGKIRTIVLNGNEANLLHKLVNSTNLELNEILKLLTIPLKKKKKRSNQ